MEKKEVPEGFAEELKGSELWMPEKIGDILEGTVKEIRDGDYGKQVVLDLGNGKTIMTPSHKILQSRIASLKEGDQIRILYEGEDPPKVKGQSPTRLYRVFRK